MSGAQQCPKYTGHTMKMGSVLLKAEDAIWRLYKKKEKKENYSIIRFEHIRRLLKNFVVFRTMVKLILKMKQKLLENFKLAFLKAIIKNYGDY